MKDIRSQFGTSHVVGQVLALFQALLLPNGFRIEPAIQSHVAVILEYRIVDRFNNTSRFSSFGQKKIVPG